MSVCLNISPTWLNIKIVLVYLYRENEVGTIVTPSLNLTR